MHDNFTIRLTYTSTGIQAECVTRSGQVLATREIGKATMQHWVSEHADRRAAIEFDACIDSAVSRDEQERVRENPRGNLAGLFDATAMLISIASGSENVA